jgi:3',5'-cyclic AMP phosphodiesterase CpdA
MNRELDRRSFLRIAGMSLGFGALYQVAGEMIGENRLGARIASAMAAENGEAPSPFTFVQLSDTHVGFNGPPDPLGTKAFEQAVRQIAKLPQKPELVIFTGDLTHDSEQQDERVARMKMFKQIAGGLGGSNLHYVPGEHDAGIDEGKLYRELFGETSYSFDYRGVHFVALDNVSRAKPEVGPERIAWLKRDLARFPSTAPIIVFTHRPLFDLKPDWEWFTSDGPDVMNVLAPYENVTVLYGHIHREDIHEIGHSKHLAARSLIFAFPDPALVAEKKPLPFDKASPFKNLGIRVVSEDSSGAANVNDVELSMNEYSGTVGIQQLLKGRSLL